MPVCKRWVVKLKGKIARAEFERKVADKALLLACGEVDDLEVELAAQKATNEALAAELEQARATVVTVSEQLAQSEMNNTKLQASAEFFQSVAKEVETANKRRFAAEDLLRQHGLGKLERYLPQFRQ